ncbi:hypothetical protein H0H10_13705 [Streptomyces sp. TRM S81-3]|uniref:Uncharacterized protein n=1 Tax=Streptomyces griseicoloratus TaxID=2752516 RepID=A0A926L0G3_9ACTN|nr:hypothetical protein [Streptomyces griseicoloratus]MBD0420210.1 hypothetical protein [Streptomyces griseicoloratus]
MVGGGAAVLALSGAGQASAGAGESLDSKTTGAHAYSHGTNGAAAVLDNQGDSHAVYNLYDRLRNTGLRLDNHEGYGNTTYTVKDESNYVQKVTACVNLQLTPDRCGPDDRPNDGN